MSNKEILYQASNSLSGKWLRAFPLIYVSSAKFYEYLKNKQQTKSE